MGNPDRCYIAGWACLICANVHAASPSPIFWAWSILAVVSFYFAANKND